MTSPTRKRRDKLAVRVDAESEASRRLAEAEELKRAKQAEAERSPFYEITPGGLQLIRRAIRERWEVRPENVKRILEDVFRPIHNKTSDNRLVLAVGRTYLAMIETELQDRIAEDRKRLKKEREHSRQLAKQQQRQNRVEIVPPKPKPAIVTKPETEVLRTNHSQFSDTFTKEREAMSYGNRSANGNETPATPAPPQWQEGFILHPVEDVQAGPRKNLHWRFEYLSSPECKCPPREFVDVEGKVDLTATIDSFSKEWLGHFLQRHVRSLKVLREWPHPFKPSEMVQGYHILNGRLHEFVEMDWRVSKRMLQMVCGMAESDTEEPEESATTDSVQLV